MISLLQAETMPARNGFVSHDLSETGDYVARTLAPHRMEVREPHRMAARIGCFEVGAAQIVDIQYGTDVWIDAGELDSQFLIHAAISGASGVWEGGVEGVMRPDNLHISSPGSPVRYAMTSACRHLTVKLGAGVFEDYLTRVMNIAINRPLVFYPTREHGTELPVAWRSIVALLVHQAQAMPNLMAVPRTQHQYVMTMIELLLSNYANSYTDQISLYGNDIAPWHVRRAREYIHENLEDTISVTELAVRVGVSVRSLQNGFREFLGVTPIEYVRRHRLEKLHRLLQESDPDASITMLMLDCGINNFGRYAQYYRQQYGCRPSDTVRAIRDRRPN